MKTINRFSGVRQTKSRLEVSRFTTLAVAVMLAAGCSRGPATATQLDATTLTNGIRLVSVCFPGSTNVSIFTFLPMGLTSDGPDQTQWSHLVEHLVIRSTLPANSPLGNAETLPDHLRLDFYGHTGNWREGLSHHQRWLAGGPFTDANLADEKPKVLAECDFTVRNFATHKFAVAAWSQGFRHGAKHVAVKGDVNKATLAEVQRVCDARLAWSNAVTVCVVSGLALETVFAEAEKQLQSVRLTGVPAKTSEAAMKDMDLSWDLDARHLLVTWPIPGVRQPGHAALMVAAQALNMSLYSDAALKSQTGMMIAGADLTTPEGNFFFISAALRPAAEIEAVRNAIRTHLQKLASDGGIPQAALIGRQLATSLTEIPDPQRLQAQTPRGMSAAMLEGNLGLQAGMKEHRYGDARQRLAQQLAKISAEQVKQAVQEFLPTTKAVFCIIRPGERQ